MEGLAKENPDEALAQAEVSTLPEARAISYVSIWELQPELDRAKVRELVDQALLNARAIKSPEQRIAIARIADKLIDLGEKEPAQAAHRGRSAGGLHQEGQDQGFQPDQRRRGPGAAGPARGTQAAR